MTIANKLTLLEQTKEAQRVKLGLPKNIPFSRYHEFFEFKFNPRYLFLNGEQGVWFDPSDRSTLFQDVAGTVPVTKDGEPVALIKDKSGNGNNAIQKTASARPIYRTNGELHWLEFDGVDDSLSSVNNIAGFVPFLAGLAVELTDYSGSTSETILFGASDGNIRYSGVSTRNTRAGLTYFNARARAYPSPIYLTDAIYIPETLSKMDRVVISSREGDKLKIFYTKETTERVIDPEYLSSKIQVPVVIDGVKKPCKIFGAVYLNTTSASSLKLDLQRYLKSKVGLPL